MNAFDPYAVGFKRYVNITVDDIRNGSFFGVAKVDVVPPKNLYVPLLPDNSEGKLLFHLNPMYQKTFTSLELKKALEVGYKITKIHSALQYEKLNGLMKEYVTKFSNLKLECSGVLTPEKCDEINEHNKKCGLNFTVEAANTCKNPGLRQVAKICLDSLWG